jgi:acetyl-CoA carboxylase biotin carboxyl carrier protein
MIELIAHRDGARTTLFAPQPGVFRPVIRSNAWLGGGDVLGTLDVLGRRIALVVPRTVAGAVQLDAGARAVAYGDSLAVLDAAARTGRADDETAPVDTARAIAGLVFRAPTSGRYYGRPTPDKPAFVAVGSELQPGATVCLLEVMKTFNRVTYSGAPARVRELLVGEGADVNAGDPILALEVV